MAAGVSDKQVLNTVFVAANNWLALTETAASVTATKTVKPTYYEQSEIWGNVLLSTGTIRVIQVA